MDFKTLEKEIRKRGFSISGLCRKAGISRSCYYARRRGNVEFTLKEIEKLTRLLHLEEPGDIFFCRKVS